MKGKETAQFAFTPPYVTPVMIGDEYKSLYAHYKQLDAAKMLKRPIDELLKAVPLNTDKILKRLLNK